MQVALRQREDPLAVGLHQVGLVDADLLHVGAGEVLVSAAVALVLRHVLAAAVAALAARGVTGAADRLTAVLDDEAVVLVAPGVAVLLDHVLGVALGVAEQLVAALEVVEHARVEILGDGGTVDAARRDDDEGEQRGEREE